MSAHAAMASPQLVELQALLADGDIDAALSACRARIAQQADDADAHRHLAQLLAARGELVPAQRHAHRSCELAPNDARAWSDLGRVCAMRAHYVEAVHAFVEALRIDPRHADAWHNLGTAYKQLGETQPAFDALKTALQLDPTRAGTYLNLGNLLIAAAQYDDAVECFERAAQHDPQLAQARSRLAQQLSERGQVQRAETLFRQSLGLDPEQLQSWFGLGRTLEDLGQAEGALGCYRNVLQRRGDHAPAIGQYLALVEGDADAAVLDRANAAMQCTGTRDEAKALIGYGLLKYHDRRKNIAAAAQAGIAANAARRRQAGALNRAALTERVDQIIATYTRDFFTAKRRLGLGTDQPVFIVGLPRSGTTLTEQILAAHPLLHGAGELTELSLIASRCVPAGEPLWQAPLHLDEMSSRERGLEYLKVLRAGAPKGRLRISDKSPLNFFQLGLACVLFPNARVVHCRRELRDNALSIWMENFKADQRYATDFDDLAYFSAEYRRLMAHWREHLPLPMLELSYEATVAGVETQARRLTVFLGVPWDARCLDFHRSERAVQTPSRWQVRQPIYTKSVERWRRYAEHLPELATIPP